MTESPKTLNALSGAFKDTNSAADRMTNNNQTLVNKKCKSNQDTAPPSLKRKDTSLIMGLNGNNKVVCPNTGTVIYISKKPNKTKSPCLKADNSGSNITKINMNKNNFSENIPSISNDSNTNNNTKDGRAIKKAKRKYTAVGKCKNNSNDITQVTNQLQSAAKQVPPKLSIKSESNSYPLIKNNFLENKTVAESPINSKNVSRIVSHQQPVVKPKSGSEIKVLGRKSKQGERSVCPNTVVSSYKTERTFFSTSAEPKSISSLKGEKSFLPSNAYLDFTANNATVLKQNLPKKSSVSLASSDVHEVKSKQTADNKNSNQKERNKAVKNLKSIISVDKITTESNSPNLLIQSNDLNVVKPHATSTASKSTASLKQNGGIKKSWSKVKGEKFCVPSYAFHDCSANSAIVLKQNVSDKSTIPVTSPHGNEVKSKQPALTTDINKKERKKVENDTNFFTEYHSPDLFRQSNDSNNISFDGNNTSDQNEFETMDVDDEQMLLCDLQEVRNQTSHILKEHLNFNNSNDMAIYTGSTCTFDSIQPQKSQSLIVIIDTNVLITSVKFLQELLATQTTDYGKPFVLLPWVVMQELDYLKNKKSSIQNKNDAVAKRAATAVRFIHSQLMLKNPQLIGQTAFQANEPTDFTIESNDDRVLQCYFQTQKKEKNSVIILITKDLNLANKAVIMGIQTADTWNFWSLIKVIKSEEKNFSDFSKSSYDTILMKKVGITPKPVSDNSSKLYFNAQTPTLLRSQPMVEENKIQYKNVEMTSSFLNQATFNQTVLQPETSTEDESLVLAKFESVWKIIFDVKNQVNTILSHGRSHVDFSSAIEMCHRMGCLLQTVKQNFERILMLSPVVLFNFISDFKNLSEILNTFYVQAGLSCVDPSMPVSAEQLIHVFKKGKHRSTLNVGLEQLTNFMQDFQQFLALNNT